MDNKRESKPNWRFIAAIPLFGIFMSALLSLIFAATPTLTSVKSGAWSDPSTWSTGAVPGANDTVSIQASHNVTYDLTSSQVKGVVVDGSLSFDPAKTTTLESSANVVINGMLVMNPASTTINHTLRFVGIDESKFVGGGMDVLDSDVGLWVMGDGQLYTKGAKRSGWLRMANGMQSGQNSFTLESAPQGWQTGDTISIAPNDVGKGYDPANSKNDFHEATITALNGSTVTIDRPVVQNYPKVKNLWTTEVMNLTRNVTIGGTASGKSHSFIRSTKPQFVRYTTFEHMGPRGGAHRDHQTGRYGLHFHHGLDGSVGSIVEGTVVKDTNNHAFVPHMSNGITFRDTVSYNTFEDAYWWDESETTHDVLYDHAIAAKVSKLPDTIRFGYAGFFFGAGDGNAIRNSVGVGIDSPDAGAFFWDNGSNGLWEFDHGNVSHNNTIGMRVWQNTVTQHTIRDLVAYHNEGAGVVHGAYGNNYLYENIHLYANGPREYNSQFSLGANSRGTEKIRVINSILDAGGRTAYALTSGHSAVPSEDNRPAEFRNITFAGYTNTAIRLEHDQSGVPHKFDIIDPMFANANEVIVDPAASTDSWVRIQKPNTSYRISRNGTTPISRVAPTIWGTGTGLKVTWFDDQNLQDKKAEDIFQYIEFESELLEPPHHKVNNPDFSARFEGQIEAHFSETYTFHAKISDGQRLYINGQPVIDSWRNQMAEERTGTFTFVAGQKYDFVLEVYEEYNQGAQVAKGAINLEWSSPRTPRAYIPTSQFYPKQPLPERDPVIAADPQLPTGSTGGGTSSTGSASAAGSSTTGGTSTTGTATTSGGTTGTTSSAGSTSGTNCSKYDLDGNDRINVLDALVLLNNRSSTDTAKFDIDGNGSINILDALVLLNNRNCQ